MDDESIGQNIARLRGEMSQVALAEQMKARGWKWSQSTVWSVEKGDRPLRLREAVDLAQILKSSMDALIRRPWEADITSMLREAMTALKEDHRGLAKATHRFIYDMEHLENLVESKDIRQSDSLEVQRLGNDAAALLHSQSLWRAIKLGAREYAFEGTSEEDAVETISDHGGIDQYTINLTRVRPDEGSFELQGPDGDSDDPDKWDDRDD